MIIKLYLTKMRIIFSLENIKVFYLIFTFFLSMSDVHAQPKYETRGVWIATLKNIDWPHNSKENSVKQKQDLIRIINELDALNINTVIFQVRPAADAFYSSSFEPWSEWLTGKQGKVPTNLFDPLQTIVDECHKRGMQVHAWLNPFRLVSNVERSDIAENHISRLKPEWNVPYGKDIYANPGLPEVRQYIGKIVADIVQNYDVDAIHMDDYFYPYPRKGEEFNDSVAFQLYGGDFYPNDLPAWRRQNVNQTVKIIHDNIKKNKPYVQFGIAPFGIWRNQADDPRGSATRGLANYDQLYADVLFWMENKWVDYVSPQLYWPIESKYTSFRVLNDWWAQNSFSTTLYSGHAFYRVEKDAKNALWKNIYEIPNQINISRNNKSFSGVFLYNTSSVLRNNINLSDTLKQNLFKYKSFPDLPLIVEMKIPSVPQNMSSLKQGNELFLFWDDNIQSQKDSSFYYAIYLQKGDIKGDIIQTKNLAFVTNQKIVSLERKRFVLFPQKYTLAVTSLNRFYKESESSEKIVIKGKIKNKLWE